MSLFGSSPDNSGLAASSRSEQQSSLFDDIESSGTKSGSGLFDTDGANGDSPWSMPTPKKGSKGDMVRTLLPTSDVPESFGEAFDILSESEFRSEGGDVRIDGVKKLLDDSGVDSAEQGRILRLVTGDRTLPSLGRNEFNVLIALVGLAQENEESTLDSVDERRKRLPEPSLPLIERLRAETDAKRQNNDRVSQKHSSDPDQTTPDRSRRLRKDSLENLTADPWGSPAMHRGHTHIVNNEDTPRTVATAAKPLRNGIPEPSRTTSAFTTHSEHLPPEMHGESEQRQGAIESGGAAWDSFPAAEGGFPDQRQAGLGSAGFGSGGDESSQSAPGRSIGGGNVLNRGVEETVTIILLPEKEGLFMFQHHNYEVKSARRASSVVRRYSDFVWLLDCLHRRYPFRLLPLLPPKRVAVNGRHLSADTTFIEKRRRGLVRFANALVRHPILVQEQLVIMFLTVPTELAVWRKQAAISVQEEFAGKSLTPGLEDSLPLNLSETFDTVRSGVMQSTEKYIGLCGLLERLTKRNQGVAADYLRFSQALLNLTEVSQSTYAIDTNDIPSLNAGIGSTARHLTTSQSLLEDEARAWDEGVLEDFKKQRDTLVGVRDMFDRRDRYAKDNIPQLERRIENNETKLAGLMGRPEGAASKPGEQEKLEQAVRADKQSIVDQHARGVFIKECIRDELVFFQQSQYHISRLHQDWSTERVKYAELQADNWRALSDDVEHMPLGE